MSSHRRSTRSTITVCHGRTNCLGEEDLQSSYALEVAAFSPLFSADSDSVFVSLLRLTKQLSSTARTPSSRSIFLVPLKRLKMQFTNQTVPWCRKREACVCADAWRFVWKGRLGIRRLSSQMWIMLIIRIVGGLWLWSCGLRCRSLKGMNIVVIPGLACLIRLALLA